MNKRLFSVLLLSLAAVAVVAQQKPYSVRMAESEMARHPDAATLDGVSAPKWNYTTGLELLAVADAAERYDISSLADYALSWADLMVADDGTITTYKLSNHNLDHLCPGRLLFRALDVTGNGKYRKALATLREQIASQPRTAEGGFWHKKIYPDQMWLDGLYMAEPFYAEYVKRFGGREGADRKTFYKDIVHQFILVGERTFDPSTGLYRHAWDSSKKMFWADSSTGQSAHAWGRALGWYAMAIVETLDYLPVDTEGRDEMIAILRRIVETLPRYADAATGMWYQVIDSPQREGNYLEATCSAMFTYTMLKAVRKGYIDHSYRRTAAETYEKFVRRFVRENPDGTISITDCCSVAGLGGKENRSGTFEYYISEPVIENDCKGVGPFIWASLEYEALNNIDYAPERIVSVKAFPTAEGGGMYCTGGRGGKVLRVTSTADDGSEGTLRWALEQPFARTIIFDVDGNIELTKPLHVRYGNLTVAGQTAPGDGICITGYGTRFEADNIIVRYLRFRLGDNDRQESDAAEWRGCNGAIVDHCSFSWSTDECASSYGNRNFTMQWCILSESLNRSVHSKGDHGYGAIWGGRNATFHHNLLAHHASRNPRLDHPNIYHGSDLLMMRGTVEYANNVVYNWGYKACYGGEEGWWNVVGNYYKAGPDTSTGAEFLEASVYEKPYAGAGSYYIDGNVLEGNESITADNWRGVKIKGGFTRQQIEHAVPFATTYGGYSAESAAEAYRRVLERAGASFRRDAVDSRVTGNVRNGGRTAAKGIINSQTEVGGWPKLKSGKPRKDSDGDGIPDRWERRHGLSPHNADDGSAVTASGYTNLELYIFSLAD